MDGNTAASPRTEPVRMDWTPARSNHSDCNYHKHKNRHIISRVFVIAIIQRYNTKRKNDLLDLSWQLENKWAETLQKAPELSLQTLTLLLQIENIGEHC